MAQIVLSRDTPATLSEKDQLFVILPCFNEEKNLTPLFDRIYKAIPDDFSCKVIAVDDGSIDGTSATIKYLSGMFNGVSLVSHIQNQGLGMAISTGVRSAIQTAKPDDLIVIMDADNTHNPNLIQQMVSRSRQGYDVVIASRYIKGGLQKDLPPLRIVLSRTLNLLIRAMTRLPVRDATSGYRGYRASLLRKVLDDTDGKFVESKGFESSLEILTRAYWCGGRISEIPLQLEYGRKEGESKMHLLPTIKGYLRLFSQIHRWRTSSKA